MQEAESADVPCLTVKRKGIASATKDRDYLDTDCLLSSLPSMISASVTTDFNHGPKVL